MIDALEIIKEQLVELSDQTVVLIGSFGRGEGTIKVDPTGYKFLNDIEIWVIRENDRPLDVVTIESKLKENLHLDFVDIDIISKEYLSRAELNLFHYDIKYGSTVLFGNKNILELMPSYPNKIPLIYFRELFGNRIAGMLIAFKNENMISQYHINQIVKFLISCGDWLVNLQGKYNVLYRKRYLTLVDLEYPYKKEIEMAYLYKLSESRENEDEILEIYLSGAIYNIAETYWMQIKRYFRPTLVLPINYIRVMDTLKIKYLNRFNIHSYLFKLFMQKRRINKKDLEFVLSKWHFFYHGK